MRRLFVGLLVLVLLLVGAALATPFVLPDTVLRRLAETAASRALGRELVIEGAFALHPWPPLSLEADSVRLADASWTGRADMVRLERIELAVDLPALLGGVLRIDRLRLARPSIVLERAADGRVNWRFGEAGRNSDGEPDAREPGGPPRILVADAAITGGEILFVDHAGGAEHELRELDLRLDAARPGELALDARALVRGEPVVLQGTVPAPERLLAAEESPLVLKLVVPGGSARIEGSVKPTDPALAASAEVTLEELRRTFAWLAVDAGTPAGTLERLVVAADVRADPARVALPALRLELDGLAVEGAAEVDLARSRPFVEATLTTATLALDPYLPVPAPQAEEPGGTAPVEPEGWPGEPLDLPLPLPVDLAVSLGFAGLEARGLVLGEGLVGVRIEGRRARLELPNLALYGGNAEGELTVEAGPPHRVAGRVRVSEVDIRPLLSALAEFDRLEATGSAVLDATTQGASVRDMIAGLDGAGEVRLRDGAIRGIDVAAMVRQVATLGRSGGEGRRKTDFAELGGTFVVEDGILRSEDVALRAPLLRLAAEGRVDLPARTLDWRIEPRFASTLEGQDATAEPAFQTGVPIRLRGPWSDPEWSVEFGEGAREVLSDPGQLGSLVEGLRKRAGGEAAAEGPGAEGGGLRETIGGALGGLLGTEAAPSTPPPPSGGAATGPGESGEAPSPLPGEAGDLLRGLIGR